MKLSRKALAAAACASLCSVPTVQAWDFFIDEVTSYPTNTCDPMGQLSNVNTVTASLRTTLNNGGITGERWLNADAWPQDFYESCYNTGSPGQDDLYADHRSLAIFAGHGSVSGLWFGYPHDGKCGASLSTNVRLGSMSGASAGYAMYLLCETLQTPSGVQASSFQWLKQQFGFRNIVGIGDNEARDFYNATTYNTGGTTNNIAWLDQMDGGGRQPLVVTQDTTESNCWASHSAYRLAGGIGTSPPTRSGGPSCNGGYPSFYYCYSTR